MRRLPWLLVLRLLLALPLVALGFRQLHSAFELGGYGAAAPALFGLIAFILAGVLFAPSLLTLLSRPFGLWLGGLFYHEDRFTAPPDDLLFSLRLRILDRHFASVDQQLAALRAAYGDSPELLHLVALAEAARGRPVTTVTAEAARVLPSAGFERYLALLQKIPPTAPPA
jgi:hypothetical protein